jgi:hypothetical protein
MYKGLGVTKSTSARFLRDSRECCIDLAVSFCFEDVDLKPQGGRRRLHLFFGAFQNGDTTGKQGDPTRCRHQFSQQAEALFRQRREEGVHPGHVATWPVEAGDEPGTDGIGAGGEHNWNRYGRSFCRRYRGSGCCNDD